MPRLCYCFGEAPGKLCMEVRIEDAKVFVDVALPRRSGGALHDACNGSPPRWSTHSFNVEGNSVRRSGNKVDISPQQ